MFFGEGFPTFGTAEALKAVSVPAKSFAGITAVVTRHSIYLDLSVKASQNGDCGSSVWLAGLSVWSPLEIPVSRGLRYLRSLSAEGAF